MAFSTLANKISYAGNVSTVTAYPIPFPFLESAHIGVAVKALGASSATALTGSEFTVTRLTDGGGGSIRTAAAIPATSTVMIERLVPITQPTVLPLAGPFPAPAVETGMDRLTMICQQLAAQLALLTSRVAELDGGSGGGDVVIIEPSGPADTTITLANATMSLDVLTNYRITATFSGVGAFADTLFETRMGCDKALVTITPEEGKRSVGRASWLVFVPAAAGSGYGDPVACVLSAVIRGRGWTGATTAGIAATWTAEVVA